MSTMRRAAVHGRNHAIAGGSASEGANILDSAIHTPMMENDTMTENTLEDAPERRPFAAFLQEQRQGDLASELAERLQEIAQAVIQYEKTGSLTLTIKVAPTKMEGALFVTDEVKANVPTAQRGGSFMFSDAKGNLMRQNPNQLSFDSPLKAVPGADDDIAHVPAADGTVVQIDTTTGEVRS